MPEFTTQTPSADDKRRAHLEQLQQQQSQQRIQQQQERRRQVVVDPETLEASRGVNTADQAAQMERFTALEPEAPTAVTADFASREEALAYLERSDPEISKLMRSKLQERTTPAPTPTPQTHDRPVVVNEESLPALTFRQKMARRLGFQKSDAPKWFQVLGKQLPRPVVLGVSSFKGGSGKTTVSSTVAAVLKRARPQDRIIMVDLDPSGNLANRAEGAQRADVQDFAAAVTDAPCDPAPFVMSTADHVDVLASRMDPLREDLSAVDIVRVIESLSQFYDIIVVDMPIRTHSVEYQAMVSMLDAFAFVFEAKDDAVRSVDHLVPVLRDVQAEYLTDKLTAVFNHAHTTTTGFDVRPIAKELVQRRIEAIEMPHDEYLFRAGELDAGAIDVEHYEEFIKLAAVMLHACEVERTVPKPTFYRREHVS